MRRRAGRRGRVQDCLVVDTMDEVRAVSDCRSVLCRIRSLGSSCEPLIPNSPSSMGWMNGAQSRSASARKEGRERVVVEPRLS